MSYVMIHFLKQQIEFSKKSMFHLLKRKNDIKNNKDKKTTTSTKETGHCGSAVFFIVFFQNCNHIKA